MSLLEGGGPSKTCSRAEPSSSPLGQVPPRREEVSPLFFLNLPIGKTSLHLPRVAKISGVERDLELH